MALQQLLEEKLGRLFSVPERLISVTGKIQSEIFLEVLSLLNTLDRKGDVILLNEANIIKIELISERMSQIIFGTEYTEALVTFASEFNTQAVLNKDLLNTISKGKFVDKDIFKAILRKSQADTISLLSEEAIQATFVDPMKRILTDSVSSEVSFRDATKQLKDFIEGTEELDGSLQRHVKQVARDGFNISDRRYTAIVSEDLGFEWFRYAGSTVKDSRVFCIDRVGKVFHITEIEGWGVGKDVGKAGFPWQGMFRGTNPDNITAVLGGYNCMHALIPVSELVVPKEVKARIK